jgi:hypothetical protein
VILGAIFVRPLVASACLTGCISWTSGDGTDHRIVLGVGTWTHPVHPGARTESTSLIGVRASFGESRGVDLGFASRQQTNVSSDSTGVLLAIDSRNFGMTRLSGSCLAIQAEGPAEIERDWVIGFGWFSNRRADACSVSDQSILGIATRAGIEDDFTVGWTRTTEASIRRDQLSAFDFDVSVSPISTITDHRDSSQAIKNQEPDS